MIDLSSIKNYYIACGYTDLRRGIDGLAQIVILQYGYEINENSLFLFCGRRTDRIKALWFSGDGFVLLYKRLNNGHLFSPIPKLLAWGRRRDSNPQPTESQSVDLTN